MPGGNNVVVGNILVDNCSIPYILNELKNWDMPGYFKDYYTKILSEWSGWTNRPELIMPLVKGEPDASWSDYNIFYRSGNRSNPDKLAFGRNWNIDYAYGLKDWQEKTGWDEHSAFVQPTFVGEANRDFRPADDSPALWFVKKVDMGIRFGLEGTPRPGYHIPVTAGPYGGREDQFQLAEKGSPSDLYRYEQLKPVDAGDHHRLPTIPRALSKAFPMDYITPSRQGIKVNNVPFTMKGSIFLSNAQNPPRDKHTQNLNWTVQKLYFLIAGAPGEQQPFARCTIQRDDGMTITLDLKGDAEENLDLVQPSPSSVITSAWSGNTDYWHEKARSEPARVFLLTWTNDNPWLPVRTVEFSLLNPKAELVVVGLTGENRREPESKESRK